jgi:hypothetical protein
MKYIKICLILLLSFICFGQPSNVFGKSWIDGDLDQLFNSENSGIVYNNLRSFELETNKIGFIDQKILI